MRQLRHLTVLALLCTSCAFGSSSKSNSLELSETGSRSATVRLRSLSSSPHLYEVEDALGGLGTYVTAIKDCSLSAKTSGKAATRQLLVGMTNIVFSGQKTIPLAGGEVLHSQLSSIYEGAPLTLSVYTAKRAGCFIDIALWRPENDTVAPERAFDEQVIVGDLLSGVLPS